MHSHRLHLTLVLMLAGCTHELQDPTLMHYGEELEEGVVDVREALAAHSDAVLGESDLRRVRELERLHHDDMALHMGHMRDADDSMELCGMHQHGGIAEGFGDLDDARAAMADALDEIDSELLHHGEAMAGSSTLATALDEERRHAAAAQGLADSMSEREDEVNDAVRAMQVKGISMMCPMSSHVHERY